MTRSLTPSRRETGKVTSIQQGTARAAAEAILGFALAAVVLATSPAEAFGIGDVISDFLYNREALVAHGAQPRPTGTLFLDAGYNRTDSRFEKNS